MRGFFGTRRAKTYQCDICSEKFKDLESMEEHRRRVHHDAAPSVGSQQ